MHAKRSHVKSLSLLLSGVLLCSSIPMTINAGASDPENERTATSVEATEDSVYRVDDLAARLFQENSNFGLRTGGFTWDTEGEKRSWTYYNGIMMDAYLMLDEDAYSDDVNAFYDANITSFGTVDHTGAYDNYYRGNELESIPPTRALFDLLCDENLSNNSISKYRKMIDYVYSIMQDNKLDWCAEGAGGNFKYKKSNANWATYQVALEGLYMSQPFFMELANALDAGTLNAADFQFHSDSEPSSDEIYSEVTDRMVWIGDNLYNDETGLYSHAWGPDAGQNGQYWLQAVGYYAAALADVISMLPDDYYEEKERLVEIEKRLFDGMIKYQDAATGMWYNVINYGPELSGNAEMNEFESSGTALMAYAMMKSYVEGYIDDSYGEAGLRAFNGTVMKCLDEEGLHNIYISASVETYPEGYLSKSYETNDARGVAPLMMAATYANDAADAVAAEQAKKPSFTTYSLVLSGQIGINVFVDLPGDIQDYEDSYMAFFVNGNETDVYLDTDFQNANKDAYGFTCNVNVLQMAEEITAVYHYGEDNSETIEETFSVVDYLKYIKENSSQFDSEVVDLASAIGDYGYYCQKYLNRVNNLEDRYAPMPDPEQDPDADPNTPKYNFEELAGLMDRCKVIVDDGDGGSAVENVNYTLILDSNTVLKIYFTTKSDFEWTPDVSVQGSEAFPATMEGGRYCITIDNISAHRLADMCDIRIIADGEYKLYVSALSYAYAVLSNSDMPDDAKFAMASLYNYYEKAMAYKASFN